MSNARRAQLPVPDTVRAGMRWRCPDCDSVPRKPWRDAAGRWHLTFAHDVTCPGLAGVTALPVAVVVVDAGGY